MSFYLLCRKQESEADAIGMQLAAKACFNPVAAAIVFEKLGAAEQKEGITIPTMLRTHPLSKVHFLHRYMQPDCSAAHLSFLNPKSDLLCMQLSITA